MQENARDAVWVFPSPTRKNQYITNVQKAAERVRNLSGVSFVLHDMRRTAASLMTGMGTTRLVVAKVLNHVELGVTKVYDRHSYDQEKRRALEAWARKLEMIVAGKISKIVSFPRRV
jgi:integrase